MPWDEPIETPEELLELLEDMVSGGWYVAPALLASLRDKVAARAAVLLN